MREYRDNVQVRSTQQRTVRLAVSPDVTSSPRGRTLPILQLHRSLGNCKVGQLLRSQRLTPQGRLVGVQPKLMVGAADDQYEREADRVARQVITTPHAVASHTVQRALSSEEGKDPRLQTKPLAASITPFGQRQMVNKEESEDKEKPVQARFFTETSRESLQRQPKTERAGTMTDPDRRQFVRDATAYFTRAAQHFATVAVDAAAFEPVINAWYALLANREELIKELGGDVMLTRALQAAYTDAIRALMKQAALLFNRPQADLYRENSGRIPMWAWQQPHAMESGISTPIPAGRSSNPITGEVNFNVNGLDVAIKPDGRDPGVSGAETRLHFDPGYISARLDASGKVSSFTVSTPAATIQTFYGRGSTTSSTSGYGRGTTKEDVAGGRVTPHSTSLGFHEGQHGLDYVEFLESHPPPAFTGTVGQTNAQFNTAITRWKAAWATLNADANR
ncbi:MAG TPA: hypothetical protein VKK81_28680, partial [Candidatus Binatia bacterium]|nr:hypothetical protein [Candidatus Binatia bacterium]